MRLTHACPWLVLVGVLRQAAAMLCAVVADFLRFEEDEDGEELTSPFLALVKGLKDGFARDTHTDGHAAWRRYVPPPAVPS